MSLHKTILNVISKGIEITISEDINYVDRLIILLSTTEKLVPFTQKYSSKSNIPEEELCKIIERMQEIILFNIKNFNYKEYCNAKNTN